MERDFEWRSPRDAGPFRRRLQLCPLLVHDFISTVTFLKGIRIQHIDAGKRSLPGVVDGEQRPILLCGVEGIHVTIQELGDGMFVLSLAVQETPQLRSQQRDLLFPVCEDRGVLIRPIARRPART